MSKEQEFSEEISYQRHTIITLENANDGFPIIILVGLYEQGSLEIITIYFNKMILQLENQWQNLKSIGSVRRVMILNDRQLSIFFKQSKLKTLGKLYDFIEKYREEKIKIQDIFSKKRQKKFQFVVNTPIVGSSYEDISIDMKLIEQNCIQTLFFNRKKYILQAFHEAFILQEKKQLQIQKQREYLRKRNIEVLSQIENIPISSDETGTLDEDAQQGEILIENLQFFTPINKIAVSVQQQADILYPNEIDSDDQKDQLQTQILIIQDKSQQIDNQYINGMLSFQTNEQDRYTMDTKQDLEVKLMQKEEQIQVLKQQNERLMEKVLSLQLMLIKHNWKIINEQQTSKFKNTSYFQNTTDEETHLHFKPYK